MSMNRRLSTEGMRAIGALPQLKRLYTLSIYISEPVCAGAVPVKQRPPVPQFGGEGCPSTGYRLEPRRVTKLHKIQICQQAHQLNLRSKGLLVAESVDTTLGNSENAFYFMPHN